MRHTIIKLSAAAVLALPAWAGAASPNLVPNGDFEAGNTSFTSDYSYSPGGNGVEAQYACRGRVLQSSILRSESQSRPRRVVFGPTCSARPPRRL